MEDLLSKEEVNEEDILASLIEITKIIKDIEKKKESSGEKENETNLNKQAKSILMELIEKYKLNLLTLKDITIFRTMINYLNASVIEPFMKNKDFKSIQDALNEIDKIKDEFLVDIFRKSLESKKLKYEGIVSKYTEESIDTFVKEHELSLITNKGIKTLNEWFNEQPKIYPDLESDILKKYIKKSQEKDYEELDKLLDDLFTDKIVEEIKKEYINFGDKLANQIMERLLANDINNRTLFAVQIRIGKKITEIVNDEILWKNLEEKYAKKAIYNPKFMAKLTADYVISENQGLSDSKEKITEMILHVKEEVDRLAKLKEKAWTKIKEENLSFLESWYLINYRDLRENIWADLNINDQDYKIIISYIRNKMAEKIPEKRFANILYNRYKAIIDSLDSDSYEKMYNEIMPSKFFENAPECHYLSDEKILEIVEKVLNYLRKTIVKNLCDKNPILKQYWRETENLINNISFENEEYKEVLKIQNEKIKDLKLSSFESKILVEYMNAYLKTCYRKRMEDVKKKRVQQLKTAVNYLDKNVNVLEDSFIYQEKEDMIFHKNKILLDNIQSAIVTGAILCKKEEKFGIIIHSKEKLEKLILSGNYRLIGYEVQLIQNNQIKKLYVEQEDLELKKEKQKFNAKSNNKTLYDKKSLRKRKRASNKANRIKKVNQLKNKWASYWHKNSYINDVKPKRRKRKQFAFRNLFFIAGMFILLKSVVGIEWKEIFHFKETKQTFEDPNEMKIESLEDAIKNVISSDIEFLEIPNEYVPYVESQENESNNYKISQKESIKSESLSLVSIEEEKMVEENTNHILNLERALQKSIKVEQEIKVLPPDMDATFTISKDARLLTSMDDINVKDGYIPSFSEKEVRTNGGIVLESPEGRRITTTNFEEAVSLIEYQGYHYLGLRATNNYSNEQAAFEGFYATDDIILENKGKERRLKP